MIERLTTVATSAAAVGSGLTAGVLLAFSISVMPALKTRPAADAMATMQQINVAIVSPIFMTVFLGGAAAAVAAAVSAFASGDDSRLLVGVGAALFVVGCVVVTTAINVPLNDTLAAVEPGAPSAAETWSRYLDRWTTWNHARTAAATVGCIVLTLAARR